jgi:hypothetical protein
MNMSISFIFRELIQGIELLTFATSPVVSLKAIYEQSTRHFFCMSISYNNVISRDVISNWLVTSFFINSYGWLTLKVDVYK